MVHPFPAEISEKEELALFPFCSVFPVFVNPPAVHVVLPESASCLRRRTSLKHLRSVQCSIAHSHGKRCADVVDKPVEKLCKKRPFLSIVVHALTGKQSFRDLLAFGGTSQ